MPGYLNRLSADATGDELNGELFLDKLAGKNQHIPLHAARGETYRFFANPAGDNADLSGRWAVTFVDDAGRPRRPWENSASLQDVITGTCLDRYRRSSFSGRAGARR